MSFFKKLRKNKVVLLVVCVIVVSLVYICAQKAIDNYNFKSNNDIIEEDVDVAKEEDDDTVGNGGDSSDKNFLDSDGEISDEETDLILEEDINEKDDGAGADNELDVQTKIYVYITGEVNNPGVVILNEGSRIVDAINAAGGTTIKANVSKVNLVYVLDDGMKVNIPNDNDLKNNSNFEYITRNSGDGGNDDYLNNGEDSSTNSSTSKSSKGYSIVNINTATQTELETLPGIGPSLALKIINYRKENGKFSSIEEIKNVSGIGDSKYENLKEYITI